ncbi:OmpA family protein [Rhizobium sp. YS-1r]|uniref:OmpA family protein n=1 Tax=Rhizobium sp. YS-1r TaxID=1532558 RepID=UPI00050E2CFF|nr:OmpA family protein [Rhizobium sp. YS-1r]KGE01891.1 hypothetical protein JL39_03825 [Rhizobium sp. YS-1r]
MKRKTGALGSARIITLAAVAGVAFGPGFAAAQSLSADQMIEGLARKPKANTRSLVIGKPAPATPSMDAEDRDFLRSLPARGLKVEAKAKLDEIVAEKDLPKINLEIHFAYDSARIDEDSIPDLVKLGTALNHPALVQSRVVLNGHTDAAGGDAYNLDLSEERAAAVRDYLIDHFPIDGHRLIAIGYGEERLKNPHHPDADENRRVEVINLGAY